MISKSNILIYLVDPQAFNLVNETKTILTDFASKIDVIDMNNIPLNKTVQRMKGNSKRQKKVVDFIKNADLDMTLFTWTKNIFVGIWENLKRRNQKRKL